MNSKEFYTKKEIEGQPKLWQQVFELLISRQKEIKEFLVPILEIPDLHIILSGAGSSSFVGDAAQGLVQNYTGCATSAIATTDIVTHPQLYLPKNKPILLVSIARSGNSPESVETIALVNGFCKNVYHLIITCNSKGELARYGCENPNDACAILLPEEANDQSLAMTGSFTSMLLSLLLVFRKEHFEKAKAEIEKIMEQANLILDHWDSFKMMATREFNRVVFLGSGTMLGIAKECHLKLQELSDGAVICKYDSFLGFRHGPRAITNTKTLMVYLFSPMEHVYKYELDLAKNIAEDPRNITCISIGRKREEGLSPCFNLNLNFGKCEELNIIPAALVGQILGYYKSLALGLNPDEPSKSGTISRVVEGVTIYDHPKYLSV
ncbi:tagatose-6-phosphate ketose/aldose isomerase [Salegentibacter echinorum]|uniref:Tagatose-6-phosphate ketose/aldose isomerase n=1 Tax=Salegentibacter echinorum TaxID=1073325 RepID=A0A1M5E9L5_SALEC|nr:SIS domain-containing protein [Salegentibacter echinorum]SHF75907.1 tagatose-6-phosphate ketose/aldose isomerase [Salegentibacter echinorum]